MTDLFPMRAAAVARPSRHHQQTPVESFDEDGFTLVVEATRRLGPLPLGSATGGIARILILGDLGPEVEPWLPVALGTQGIPVIRERAETTRLLELLEHVIDEPGGTLLLLGETSRWTSTTELLSGAVGIAAWFHPESPVAIRLEAPPPSAETPHRPVRVFEEILVEMSRAPDAETRAASARIPGFSTWDPSTVPTDPELGGRNGRPPIPLDALSEGAYVPRPRYLESLPARWRFVAERCSGCGTIEFPPRGRCRTCPAGTRVESIELPLDGGVVEAVTTVHVGAQPSEFDGPVDAGGAYDVVLVRLAPGVRLPLQVTDAPPGAVHIGDPIGTVLRRLYPMEGEWRYGRKATPRRLAPSGSTDAGPTGVTSPPASGPVPPISR